MTISSSSHLAPDEVARHSFGSVRRGFDPGEVRAYLESLATGLRGLAEREHQLLSELADAEHRAANPVLDEPTLTSALGTETARVLHSAHEVAAEMVAKSEAEANRLLTEAREEIQQTRAHTEARLAEQTASSESEAEELRQRSEQQAAARIEAAREEAEAILDRAREECRGMVDEAQGLRSRVLADLSKRRKVLHAQIEQLRAGRERLAETVQDVRRSVDTIAADLFAAEDNARLAAEAAGREVLGRPDDGTPEELAALLLADEGEVDGPVLVDGDLSGSLGADTTPPVVDEVPVEPIPASGPEVADDTGPADGATTAPDEEVTAVEVVVEVESEPTTPVAPDGSPVEAVFAKIRAAQTAPDDTAAPSDERVTAADPPAAAVTPAPDKKGKKTRADPAHGLRLIRSLRRRSRPTRRSTTKSPPMSGTLPPSVVTS